MKITVKITVFMVLLTLLTSIMPTLADMLSSYDTGYDLAAGYRYAITLHICYVGPSAARAGVDAGILQIDFGYPTPGSSPHLKIIVNGNTAFDQDVSSDQVTVYVTIDHDGSGEIEVGGYGMVGGFTLDHSYRIMAYTEDAGFAIWHCSSQVTISRQQLPRPDQYNPLQPLSENEDADSSGIDLYALLGNVASTAVLMILILLGLIMILWILARMGGVRGLVKKAL